MRPRDALQLRLRLAAPRYRAAVGEFWGRPDLRDRLPLFFHHLYSIIRANVPLLEAASRAARERREHELADYYHRHSLEESGHDQWLREDMLVLGFSEAEIDDGSPSPHAADIVGRQYYLVHHHAPVALLGYLAVLEGEPPEQAEIDGIVRRTGIPDAAVRTMRKHAELDPGHRAEIHRMLDRVVRTPGELAVVGQSALATTASLCDLFESLCSQEVPCSL